MYRCNKCSCRQNDQIRYKSTCRGATHRLLTRRRYRIAKATVLAKHLTTSKCTLFAITLLVSSLTIFGSAGQKAPHGHPILLAILYRDAERAIYMRVKSTSVVPKWFVSGQNEIKAKLDNTCNVRRWLMTSHPSHHLGIWRYHYLKVTYKLTSNYGTIRTKSL